MCSGYFTLRKPFTSSYSFCSYNRLLLLRIVTFSLVLLRIRHQSSSFILICPNLSFLPSFLLCHFSALLVKLIVIFYYDFICNTPLPCAFNVSFKADSLSYVWFTYFFTSQISPFHTLFPHLSRDNLCPCKFCILPFDPNYFHCFMFVYSDLFF